MYNKLSDTHMHNQSNAHGFDHFFQSDIKKLVLDPWGNEMQFNPMVMEFDPMATKYKLMNMKHKILFSDIPFMH